MSFSQDVKTELCALPMESSCCTRAESYGILLFANVFRADEIRIITQNRAFAERVCALFQRAFGVLLTPEREFTLPASFHACWRRELPTCIPRALSGLPMLTCYGVPIQE